MTFPRYPEYKESGVEWLGEVPRHWGVAPLGRATASRCDGPFGSGLKSEHYTDTGVRVIRLQNIRSGYFDGADEAYVDQAYHDTELPGHEVVDGDVLIAGLGDDNNVVGRACVAPSGIEPAMVKADCFRFRLDRTQVLPAFAAAALTVGAPHDAGRLSTGSTRQRIPLSVMSTRKLPLPPLDEQHAIAAFLDRETARIDAVVAEQERLIKLLREKRQAVISHAVTKGLDPTVPLKDSGVDWLGEVPESWLVIPIRKVARLESGHTPSRNHPEYWENCRHPWFSLADVWQIREEGRAWITETAERVSDLGLANSAARLLPPGTVMLSRTASVGFAAIMGVEMATTQDFANWVCGDRLLPEFLLRAFHAMKGEFERLKYGSTHNTIYMPDIHAMRLALPPVAEQRTIVDHLDRVIAQLDALTGEAQRAIALLQERRAALISAAVTGQIDVRGLAPEAAA